MKLSIASVASSRPVRAANPLGKTAKMIDARVLAAAKAQYVARMVDLDEDDAPTTIDQVNQKGMKSRGNFLAFL